MSFLADRLSSLSGKDSARTEAGHNQSIDMKDVTGLVQRCVIIQRDQNGYGFTVSGDNPAYVDSIKEGGAAARSGVVKGDRIVKVNGTLVTSSNHFEVVELIKSQTYVALTLLGKPQLSPIKSPDHSTKIHRGSSSAVYPEQSVQPQRPVTPPTPTPSSASLVTAPLPPDEKTSIEVAKEKLRYIQQMHQKAIADYQELQSVPQHKHSPQKIKTLLEEKLKIVKELEHMERKTIETFTDQGISFDFLTSRDSFIFHDDASSTSSMNDCDFLPQQPPKKGISKHAKSDSVPVQLYKTSSSWATTKGVLRSNSDAQSKHRKLPRVFKGSSSRPMRSESDRSEGLYRTKYLLHHKALSLTAEGGNHSDSSIPSPNSSPTPLRIKNRPVSQYIEDDTLTPTVAHLNQPSMKPQPDIISPEDDEFSADEDQTDVLSPFTDLDQLMKRPAYISVLLNFLFSNNDPAPIFFYGICDAYAVASGSLKELHKWAYEIFTVFLVEKAPLLIPMDESIVQEIDETLKKQPEREESLRSIFTRARTLR